MAIEFNWITEKAEKRTSPINGLDHVLVSCEWRCTASDGLTTLSSYGKVDFPAPSGENFVDFDQVRQSTILNWVWQDIDKNAIEEELAGKINQLSQPETIPVSIPKD